jgi:hypothetical protein
MHSWCRLLDFEVFLLNDFDFSDAKWLFGNGWLHWLGVLPSVSGWHLTWIIWEVSDVTGLMKPPDRPRFLPTLLDYSNNPVFFSVSATHQTYSSLTGLQSTDPLTKLQGIAALAQIFAFFELLSTRHGIFQLKLVTSRSFGHQLPPTNRKNTVFIKRHQRKLPVTRRRSNPVDGVGSSLFHRIRLPQAQGPGDSAKATWGMLLSDHCNIW